MITPKEIETYCEEHTAEQNAVFDELKAATLSFAPQVAHMQVGKLEGQFLSFFAKALGAKRILEFGTFTGCSSLHFALSISEDGLITTLDRDPKAVAIAHEFWVKASVRNKIESILGDAKASAKVIEAEIHSGVRPLYDLAFIDADKGGYRDYFESALRLVKKSGWILVDNVLWSGRVLNPKDPSDHTLHEFNENCRADPRIEHLLLPLRDGIMVCRIKG